MTTKRSGAQLLISSTASSERTRAGCSGTMPWASANSLIAHGVSCRPRPAGRSGWVTTPTTSIPGMASKRRRAGRPMSPLPRKTVLIALSSMLSATGTHRSPRAKQFSRRDLALPKRVGASGAKVVVNFLVRQNKQQPLAHWHRLAAPPAVEAAGPQALEPAAHVTALNPFSPK